MLNEDLKFIYESISEWLKFAETKHAAVIVLYGAWIIGIYNIIININLCIFLVLGYVSMLCFSIALLISIISFIPILKSDPQRERKDVNLDDVNIFFFANIQSISLPEYTSVIKTKYGVQELKLPQLDLIKQIWINSKIATRKYNLFKFSVIISIIGFIISLIAISGAL